MEETYPIQFGRYELTERLAVGGMAELFLAKASGAEGFAKTIVIKRLLPHMAQDEQFNAMFIDEAKITGRLSHPKIAQTYELGRHGDQLFIAMEFVDGIDVLAMLRECAHRKVRVPAQTAIYITHEVLDALDFAHHLKDDKGQPLNIVHRDISPSNILLSKRGDVKLVDFGIARASEQEHKTKAGTLKGKYGYMSPEQVIDGGIDHRSDLFSVGIVLAEMLTGRRLFAAPNELDVLLMVRDANLKRLDKFGKDLDPSVRQILDMALMKDRDVRFQSAGDFRDALAEWMFNNRHRVTPRNIAEVVGSLYDAAWMRKKEQAEASAAADEKPAQAAGTQPPPPPMPVRRKSKISGGISMPGISENEEPPTEVKTGVNEIARGSSGRADAVPQEEMVVEDSLSIPTAEEPIELEGDLDLADGEAEYAEKFSTKPSVPRRVTTGNATLESAIATLAVQEPDPSSYDFDDSSVSGEKSKHRRNASKTVPPEAEISIGTAPERPQLEQVDGAPDEEGTFPATAPLALLYQKATGRSTGLLVTQVGGIKKEIYFRDGSPEYVSSNVAGELFGEYLVKIGAMSAGELAMALAMMPHFGGKLGDTLVGLGLMKPLEVFRHLTKQVHSKLVDVCSWSKGEYQWFEGKKNPREAFPLDLNAFEVLGAGAMSLPDAVVDEWIERVNDYKIVAKSNERISIDQFEVDTKVRDIYAKIDGRISIRSFLNRHPDEEHPVVSRTLYLLVHTELAGLK